MQQAEEFIRKLELNKATHTEKKEFLESLSVKDFISFISKDFSLDTFLSDFFSMHGAEKKQFDTIDEKSVEVRTALFEEYIFQTEQIIQKMTISDIKKALKKIKPEYQTINDMLLERFIMLVHESEENIDTKKIIEFKTRIEHCKITQEEIRKVLLSMSKAEFSFFICIGKQDDFSNLSTVSFLDYEINNMYDYQAMIIAEIIEEYTEKEIVDLIPYINESSAKIRTMFFKCLDESKAGEIFLTNAPKYVNDIKSYVLSPTQSEEKDKLIVSILSDPNLYSLFEERDINLLKSIISRSDIILDENSDIINVREEELISAAAKYIANIKGKDKPTVKRGVLKKLSAKQLYDLLHEVNKGLKNINEEEISLEEFISLTEMPVDKAVLFLYECSELTEEKKKELLNKIYKDNEFKKMDIKKSRDYIVLKHMIAVLDRLFSKDEQFDYVYRDLLDTEYNKEIFDQMSRNFTSTLFAGVPLECINIFISQLIEKEKLSLNLDIKKEFYVGRAYVPSRSKQVTLGSYNHHNNSIYINTNVFRELCGNNASMKREEMFKQFFYKITMIEAALHEIRHAFQRKVFTSISTMRDFYFMLDSILHHELYNGNSYYSANYNVDSREVDANLYAKIVVIQLLKSNKSVKEYYWLTNKEEILELSRKRKAPQLRKDNKYTPDSEKKDIVDIFFEHVSNSEIQELRDSYPMLDLIVDEYGERLSPESIQDMINELESILMSEDISPEEYSQGEGIVNFLDQYLRKVHKKKPKRRKII